MATRQPDRFKDRVVHPLQRSLVNPLLRTAWRLGLGPPGDALLETTGRRTGRPRFTPICDGQDGDTFWVVTQRGRRSDYVRNIEADPRVRVKVRRGSRTRWLAGTAHVVDADDPQERQRIMARGDFWRRLCVQASGAMSTSLLTIRIDLDRQGRTAMGTRPPIVLEPSAQAVVDATSMPPFIYELGPAAARKVLDDLQAAPIDKPPVDEEWITVPAAVGDVRVRMIRPPDATGMLPVIVYMHGGGWVLGDAGTHDRLVRELAVGARAALLFVEYPNAPEARYPVAIEQGYATAQWVVREGATNGLDASRMAVAGDSAGGNMTAALTIMAKQREDVSFVHASIYYPVTDAAMDTASYDEFAEGYYLTRKAMEWFWDAYTTDPDQRAEITASPNQATQEQLAGLPPTLLLVDEVDPLRDEGEAYAAKLRMAGVPVTTVRYDGIIHDFMLLNAMSQTNATRAAIAQATAHLREALGTT